jgi:lysophospholipase L1-like esterase
VRKQRWQSAGWAALTAAVLAGVGYLFATWPPSLPLGTPDAAAQDPNMKTISTLSDSHLVADGSWFRRTVEEGRLGGYAVGTFASQPGATSEEVRELADQTAGSDWVVVQAGTNDLLGGDSPQQAFAGVRSLVGAVREPRVILALVPPPDIRPDAVVALNGLLTRWAQEQGIPVLDVYSPVAAQGGRFRPGTSDDDVHANDLGAQLQADSALRQLRRILP